MTDIDLGLSSYQYFRASVGNLPEMGHTISSGNDNSERVWIDPEQPGGSVNIGDLSHWQSDTPIWQWGGTDSDRSNPVERSPWAVAPALGNPFELDANVFQKMLDEALEREAEELEVDGLGDVERRVDHLEI